MSSITLVSKKGRGFSKSLRIFTVLFLAFSFMVCFASTASASPDTVIDTFPAPDRAGGLRGSFGSGEVFTVPATDTALQSIAVGVCPFPQALAPDLSINLRLYSWDGSKITGLPLFTGNAVVSNVLTAILPFHCYLTTFNLGNLDLVAGGQYAFEMINPTTGEYFEVTNDVYPGGSVVEPPTADESAWTTTNWTKLEHSDLAFRATFVTIDTIAPTVSPTQSPDANSNGWNKSDVTVNWNWTDNTGGSGIDPANCTTTSTSSGEGSTITLNATCKDLKGNTGTANYTVKVDKTAPTVTYMGNAGTYTVDQTINITCNAADNLSGSGIASTTCANVSDPAYNFLGSNTLSATATDKAGNEGSGSTSFTVGVSFDSLCTLSASLSTDPGVGKGLCAKLVTAKAANNDKTRNNILNAYRHQVVAQSGKALTTQQATTLTNLSKQL